MRRTAPLGSTSASVRPVNQAAPGWYPDPWQQSGQPSAIRWWDGAQWTSHAQLAAPDGAVAAVYQRPVPTTPDGAELAGWGRRLGALLLDSLILAPVILLASTPFWGDIADAVGDWWDETTTAIDAGAEPPDGTELQDRLGSIFFAIGLINVAIHLTYYVGFLTWKQATPGKLLLGLRVRLRERDALPLGTILLRWGAFYGPTLVATLLAVPLGGAAGLVTWPTQIYGLVNGLWPLWDSKRQALHDKVARTNVVLKDR